MTCMMCLPRRSHIRRFMAYAAVAFLLLRSIMPAGFMPDFSPHVGGWLAFTLCDGMQHGAGHQHVHEGHAHHAHEEEPGHSGKSQQPCPFGLSLMQACHLALGASIVAGFLCMLVVDVSFIWVGARKKNVRFANVSPRSPPIIY